LGGADKGISSRDCRTSAARDGCIDCLLSGDRLLRPSSNSNQYCDGGGRRRWQKSHWKI
jgi:hypothetical protein